MGVPFQSDYTTTNHYIQRANQRFNIPKNPDSAINFFRQNAPYLLYCGLTKNGSATRYSDGKLTFILNEVEKVVVTCYPNDRGNDYYDEVPNEPETIEKNDIIDDLKFDINDIVRTHKVRYIKNFCLDNQELISNIFELMQSLPNTKRNDYVNVAIEELFVKITEFNENVEAINSDLTKLTKYEV